MIRLRTELNLVIEIPYKEVEVWEELDWFLYEFGCPNLYGLDGALIIGISDFKSLMNFMYEHSTPGVQEIFRTINVDMIRNSYDYIIFKINPYIREGNNNVYLDSRHSSKNRRSKAARYRTIQQIRLTRMA